LLQWGDGENGNHTLGHTWNSDKTIKKKRGRLKKGPPADAGWQKRGEKGGWRDLQGQTPFGRKNGTRKTFNAMEKETPKPPSEERNNKLVVSWPLSSIKTREKFPCCGWRPTSRGKR